MKLTTLLRKFKHACHHTYFITKFRNVKLKLPLLYQIEPYKNSIDFSYARGSYMHKLIHKNGLKYEGEVTSLLLSLLGSAEKSVFIDVGGNIGYFPILLGGILGGKCEITVFEPLPKLFNMCVSGIQNNGVEVSVRQEAMSDSIGDAIFYVSAETDSSNSLNPNFRKHKDEIKVDLSTLDHFFLKERNSCTIANLIKAKRNDIPIVLMIDTESTEPSVLKGAKQFIKVFRPHIICEVLAGRTEDALMNYFQEVNYSFYRLSHNGIHHEQHVFGDTTYQFRDWYFCPQKVSPNVEQMYMKYLKSFT